MDFADYIKSFPIRTDIFDDITYLQKHLRIIIKFHQKLSSKLYVFLPNCNNETGCPSRNFSAIRQFMDELESEMEDISEEQKMLTDIIKKSLNNYHETLQKENNIKIDNDVANGFITRAIQYHYQKNCSTITPNNVKTRMSEEELKQRYEEIRMKNESDRILRQLTGGGMERKHAAQIQSQEQQQESLIKPKFRKPPSTATTTTAVATGRVEKKTAVVAKSSTIETRLAKVVQKRNATQQSITGSRLNLIRALNKVKTEQVDNSQYSDYSDNGKYIRSDEDCSDQSSYDGTNNDQEPAVDPLKISRKRRSPASNTSSDSDLMKSLPPLPLEPPPKLDYTQEEFLSIFMLITPSIADEIRLQRTKRKRRNCFKNEKDDFHYGKFDLNEAAYRLKMCSNRRSILYSPNNKKK